MKRILYFCGLGLMVLLGGYTAVAWGMTRGLGAYRLNTQVGAVLAGSWQITGLLALAALLALILPTVRLVRGLMQNRARRAGMPRSVPFAPASGYAPQSAAPAWGAPAGQPGQSGVPPYGPAAGVPGGPAAGTPAAGAPNRYAQSYAGNAPTVPAGAQGDVTVAAPGVRPAVPNGPVAPAAGNAPTVPAGVQGDVTVAAPGIRPAAANGAVPPQAGNAPTVPAGVQGDVTAAAPAASQAAQAVPAAEKPAVHRVQFCTRCGKKAELGQRFCTGCGAPLEEE